MTKDICFNFFLQLLRLFSWVEGAHSRESLMVERDDGNWIGIDAIGILFDPLDECGQE